MTLPSLPFAVSPVEMRYVDDGLGKVRKGKKKERNWIRNGRILAP